MLSGSRQFSVQDLNAGIEYKYGLVNKDKPKDILEYSALPGKFNNRRIDAPSILKTLQLKQRSSLTNQGYRNLSCSMKYLERIFI